MIVCEFYSKTNVMLQFEIRTYLQIHELKQTLEKANVNRNKNGIRKIELIN